MKSNYKQNQIEQIKNKILLEEREKKIKEIKKEKSFFLTLFFTMSLMAIAYVIGYELINEEIAVIMMRSVAIVGVIIIGIIFMK